MKKLLTEKKKKTILVFLILWLLLAIVFIIPLSVDYTDSLDPKGELQTQSFMSIAGQYILNITTRIKAFQEPYKSNTTSFFVISAILTPKLYNFSACTGFT